MPLRVLTRAHPPAGRLTGAHPPSGRPGRGRPIGRDRALAVRGRRLRSGATTPSRQLVRAGARPRPGPGRPRLLRRAAAPAVALSIAVAGTSACAPSSQVGPGAVTIAAAQSGKPYRYGATGPSSFDCSGLVQYVYQRLGRHLPRTAAAQYYASRHVSRGSARPGDLVFFGAPFGVYHVGIYAGGGQMIDAPHSGAVVTTRRIWSARVAFGRVY